MQRAHSFSLFCSITFKSSPHYFHFSNKIILFFPNFHAFPLFPIFLHCFHFLFHNLVSKSTGVTYDWCDPPKGLGTFDIILAFEWYVYSLYLHVIFAFEWYVLCFCHYKLCCLVIVTYMSSILSLPSFSLTILSSRVLHL